MNNLQWRNLGIPYYYLLIDLCYLLIFLAEDKRFELLRQLPTYTLSKGAHSATMRILHVSVISSEVERSREILLKILMKEM